MNGPLIVRKDGWTCGTGNRRMDEYISQNYDCDVNRHFRHIHRAINWGGTKVNMNRKRILIKTPTKRYRKFFFSIQLMKRPCNVCAMCDKCSMHNAENKSSKCWMDATSIWVWFWLSHWICFLVCGISGTVHHYGSRGRMGKVYIKFSLASVPVCP